MWQWDPIRDWLATYITPYWTTPLLLAVQTLMVMVCLILVMAFYTLAERKVIGWIQARKGPNRVNLLFIPGRGPAVRGCGQAPVQGDHDPGERERISVPARAVSRARALARHLGGDPVRAGARVFPHRCGASLHSRAHLDGRLRHHPRRLGGELQVRVPGRDALGGADRRLRDRDGLRHGGRAHGRGKPQHRRHRPRAGGGPVHLELDLAVSADARVLHLGGGRDQPRAVRRGRGRVGDRRRIPRRLLGDGVRAVFHRRIREHDPDLGAHGDLLLRRLALAVRRLVAVRTAGSRSRAFSGSA